MLPRPPRPPLFPYTTLFRSPHHDRRRRPPDVDRLLGGPPRHAVRLRAAEPRQRTREPPLDRKSTRLNSSHLGISYAVFCLKKKNNEQHTNYRLITHCA